MIQAETTPSTIELTAKGVRVAEQHRARQLDEARVLDLRLPEIRKLAVAVARVETGLAKMAETWDDGRGKPPCTFREAARFVVDALIEALDRLDGDADAEPSFGWAEMEARFRRYSTAIDEGEEDDPAEEAGDAEPSLGSIEEHCRPGFLSGPAGDQTYWAAGNRGDLEDEHDGSEAEGMVL